MKQKEKEYGIADRAWQPVVGCSPNMPCAPRCWARKTVARVVECQKPTSPERVAFYQIALTPDGKKWSGEVVLDEAHLLDPLKWRKPALIATGFHGDLFRLGGEEIEMVFTVTALCQQHRFMLLTKCPDKAITWLTEEIPLSSREECVMARSDNNTFYGGTVWDSRGSDIRNYFGVAGVTAERVANRRRWPGFPFANVSIGCSVMNQQEADKMREPMAQIAALGWNTHCWYEPALGPVDWKGWEFLDGIIAGGESGPDSRPAEAAWFRQTARWCEIREIPFRFKQWGDYCDWDQLPEDVCREMDANGYTPNAEGFPYRVGKKAAGRLLDGREWNGVPRFGSAAQSIAGNRGCV